MAHIMVHPVVPPDDAGTAHRRRLGRTIRGLRIADGQTQGQLAEALGISEAHLTSVERGDIDASPALRKALERVFVPAFGAS